MENDCAPLDVEVASAGKSFTYSVSVDMPPEYETELPPP